MIIIKKLVMAIEVINWSTFFNFMIGICLHYINLLQTFELDLQYQQLMGQCMKDKPNARSDNGPRYDQVPTQNIGAQPNQSPLLNFHTLLTKIKLKRCVFYRQLGVRFEFAGFQEFEVKNKVLINQTARWEISHLLGFKATLFEMRQKFLNISVTDQHNKAVGTLKINLYLLATGPYHQDFAIPLPKSPGARISFNLKIAQLVKIKMQMKQVQMIPKNKQFPGDMFAFALRSIIGDKFQEHGFSYKYLVGFQAQQIKSGITQSANSAVEAMLLQTRGSKNMSSIHYDIKWTQTVSNQIPTIQAEIPLYDLHGASFNIIFYYFHQEKHQFHSQCFLSYNKLANFSFQEVKDSINNIVWQVRDLKVDLKTWDHGKQTGKAIFSIVFQIQSHIKQMQVCVRTQNGVLESSPVYGDVSNGALPDQLLQLQKLGNQIQNLFIQSTKANNRKQKNERQNWMQQVNMRLRKQKQILCSSAKESRMMFVYQDEKSLLKGQRGFIQLGFRIRALLNEDNQSITPYCWQLLIALMKRGELSLAFMGFKEKQIEDCLNGKQSQFLKRKKEVSMSYHALMIDLLHTTLQSLQAYTYESQREFAQLFCAYAYFRIPKFRNQVLAAITRANDPEIEQWRGTQFSLTEQVPKSYNKEPDGQGKNAFSLMFDWQNHFYKVIQKEQYYTKNQGKLVQMFRYNGWEERMRKRGGAFFAFIRFWVSYVENITVNSKHVSWRYFPGYNKILQSFLVEMKSRNVQDYSQAMRKAAASLLSNQKLLNPFIVILFKKTNSVDQIAVTKAFDLIHLFFSSIQGRGRTLPTTFDLKFLLKGIKNILEGQAAFSIGKVLLLLYDHYKLFPIDFRVQTCLYLISRVFFKLFLHWSGNVRTIFHHLIFIRIYHESSKPIGQMQAKDQQIFKNNPQMRTEIISRYRKIFLILENAQEFQHKIRRNKIDVYQKQAYKKIRNKINQKRRLTNTNNNTSHPSQLFSNQDQYQRQLMTELSQYKLQKYSSQVLTKNLKVAVQQKKVSKKEQVIIHSTTKTQSGPVNPRKRKMSFTQFNFQDQLTPLKEGQIVYIKPALEEYQKISEGFIQHVQKNKDSVPIVKLQLSLDQKELRPQGLSEHEEW